MCQHTCSISLLLVSMVLATIGMQLPGWLDRIVHYRKQKLFQELGETLFDYTMSDKNKHNSKNLTSRPSPALVVAEIQLKPEGYEDSPHWDYDSVLRLLALLRESETAKPVHKALRRMMQPSRRAMMSVKESMKKFPAVKNKEADLYYDEHFSSSEEDDLLPVSVPADQAVLAISNPIEAHLPSPSISVGLLRHIMEFRGKAGRRMPSTMKTMPPWLKFVKSRALNQEETSTVTPTASVKTTTSIQWIPNIVRLKRPAWITRPRHRTTSVLVNGRPISYEYSEESYLDTSEQSDFEAKGQNITDDIGGSSLENSTQSNPEANGQNISDYNQENKIVLYVGEDIESDVDSMMYYVNESTS